MNAFLQTAAGNPENQDCGAVFDCGKRITLVMADGAGGTSGGGEAATLAVELVRQQAPFLEDAGTCHKFLAELDTAIARDKIAGETTCVLAVVTDREIFGASIGDSGAWVIGKTDFVDLTVGQIRKPLVGSCSVFPISFHYSRISGDFLLLATDGLFKYAGVERITNVCRTPPVETVATRLIELVRYPSGALPDDVTVIFAAL